MRFFPEAAGRAVACLWLAAAFVAPTANAQDAYPQKPITIVVAQAAGAGSDIVARLLAREMTKEWGVSVVVDNKPGANGAIAAQVVAKAAPDGYTLLMGSATVNAANYAFYPGKLGYEPNAFDVAGLLSASPMTLLVSADAPWKTVAELVAEGKKMGGRLNCGSGLSTSQVACEYFAKVHGLAATTVNYRSSPQALTDLAGGQVQYAFADSAAAAALVQGRKLRALAVAGPEREKVLPEAPTFKELGQPDLQIMGWAGVFVPTGTPAAVVDKLNPVLRKANDAPEFVAARQKTGGVPLNLDVGQARQFIAQEIERWKKLHRDSGVKLEM